MLTMLEVGTFVAAAMKKQFSKEYETGEIRYLSQPAQARFSFENPENTLRFDSACLFGTTFNCSAEVQLTIPRSPRKVLWTITWATEILNSEVPEEEILQFRSEAITHMSPLAPVGGLDGFQKNGYRYKLFYHTSTSGNLQRGRETIYYHSQAVCETFYQASCLEQLGNDAKPSILKDESASIYQHRGNNVLILAEPLH